MGAYVCVCGGGGGGGGGGELISGSFNNILVHVCVFCSRNLLL